MYTIKITIDMQAASILPRLVITTFCFVIIADIQILQSWA